MSYSEIQIAQIKLCNARKLASQMGDDARRDCMVYLASKKRWLAQLDRVAELDRDVDEKVAIENAFNECKKRETNHDE